LGAAIFAAHGAVVTVATIGTAVVIATVRLPRIPWLAWLASISYSLYLLHVPIGMPLVALAERLSLNGPLFELLAVSLATLGSVAGAAILFRFVESPALRLASKIKYRSGRRADAHAEGPMDSPVARPE
jgi:peptidoglycan/LPS O-acetylase OafA/YrhL